MLQRKYRWSSDIKSNKYSMMWWNRKLDIEQCLENCEPSLDSIMFTVLWWLYDWNVLFIFYYKLCICVCVWRKVWFYIVLKFAITLSVTKEISSNYHLLKAHSSRIVKIVSVKEFLVWWQKCKCLKLGFWKAGKKIEVKLKKHFEKHKNK